ncbi:Hexosyltransferase [Rhynchospora pubera]|uniref:Hexosyltransferase n=1 Tax=Rhynchospora pubera TaxID=906938 RepID=A0AAV8EDF1_9POAL|nr:Hexosyltransferase [Rhynchospora pubera]
MEFNRSISILFFFLLFQGMIVVSSAKSEFSFLRKFSFSNSGDGHDRNCRGCHDEQGSITVAYTDPSGAIRTFKMNFNELSSLNQTEETADLGVISNEQLGNRSELSLTNRSETVDQIRFQDQNAKPIDPIQRKRELLRQKRRERRKMHLIHMSQENELEIQDAAINRTKNFVNKAQDRYSIWRVEYQNPMSTSVLKLMKDQIIMAKIYASIFFSKKELDLYQLLIMRIKESQDAIGDASSDNELHESALARAKAMGHALTSAKDKLHQSEEIERKIRAMLQLSEENINTAKKQNTFLVQHAAKTVPKPLHCLHLQLTNDYYNYKEGIFEDKSKLEDASLYHYAIFSDNVLATSVVVNSTVMHATEPHKHIFHIVTDRLNFPAMKMWFMMHPPSHATINVQNIDEFKWLNSSYCSVLRQLESAQIKEYYFKFNHPSSLSAGHENLKYRNPKYLSMLNHLRFYMPEVYPKLDKILFLDDDVVIQRDLTPLFSVNMKGMVNGAVETCKESFHRFDTYLNFSHPKISKNFDPRACGWAFGMNLFDLKEWKKRNITGIYHYWQDLNEDRKLWKLGSLPPGLITFYNLTYPLDRNWHVLGLGYDPAVDPKEIESAAVVHYNGNYKPWLDLAIGKYKQYWSNHVKFDNPYIQHCFMND